MTAVACSRPEMTTWGRKLACKRVKELREYILSTHVSIADFIAKYEVLSVPYAVVSLCRVRLVF